MAAVTFKVLEQAAEGLSKRTGRTWRVVPFPAPGPNGYNLYDGDLIILGGKPPKVVDDYIAAYRRGFGDGETKTKAKTTISSDQAVQFLALLFENGGVTGDEAGVEQTAKDLLDWYNCSEIDADDLKKLYDLFTEGRFRAWDCPTCNDGTRVYEAEPEDWSDFQGTGNQDFASYPGNKRNQKCCDHCRMYGEVPKNALST